MRHKQSVKWQQVVVFLLVVFLLQHWLSLDCSGSKILDKTMSKTRPLKSDLEAKTNLKESNTTFWEFSSCLPKTHEPTCKLFFLPKPQKINCFEQRPANQLFLWVPNPVQHSRALQEQWCPEASSAFSCLAHPTSSSFCLIQAAVSASCRARVLCVWACALHAVCFSQGA